MSAGIHHLIGAMRPPFLLLTPACVLLGVTAAWLAHGTPYPSDATLLLAGALFAHASVNLLNEYDDFSSGLDLVTFRTPFSGGSGTLPASPDAASVVRITGWAMFAATAFIGLYFLITKGLGLLPIGVAGLLLVALYTRWITRNPIACLLAPGLGFGPLMVLGSAYVVSGTFPLEAMAASIVPLFLVSGLLLLNQFPDVEADRTVGRHHFPIALGRQRAAYLFTALVVGAFAGLGLTIAGGLLPMWAALALAPLPVAGLVAVQVIRYANARERLLPYLGVNVIVTLGMILLLGVGLFLAV